ncbi:MAG: hypothetical protein E7207_06050 [Clostridium butyricum]|nr:hypothetical protein [Clostridium butyricum]
MLYEYPNEFIVPITYINTFDYSVENHKAEVNECFIERNIEEKNSIKDDRHKLEDFMDIDFISGSQKDYYLENINIYSDIDDEYVKEDTKRE